MKHKIENEFDYLVALAERESDHADEIRQDASNANDYWREKAAAKLAEFCKAHERFMRLFAELKLYHPEAAAPMEARWTHLKSLSDGAKKEYDDYRNKNGQ